MPRSLRFMRAQKMSCRVLGSAAACPAHRKSRCMARFCQAVAQHRQSRLAGEFVLRRLGLVSLRVGSRRGNALAGLELLEQEGQSCFFRSCFPKKPTARPPMPAAMAQVPGATVDSRDKSKDTLPAVRVIGVRCGLRQLRQIWQ